MQADQQRSMNTAPDSLGDAHPVKSLAHRKVQSPNGTLDDYLKENAKRMAANGRLTRVALWAMIATPAFAVGVLILN